jgi:hypothetical protein
LGPKGLWKVRLAAIGSEVLRIVKPQFRASCDNLMSVCGANATTGYFDNWGANYRPPANPQTTGRDGRAWHRDSDKKSTGGEVKTSWVFFAVESKSAGLSLTLLTRVVLQLIRNRKGKPVAVLGLVGQAQNS